jgi:para-nitrobenzyl esterase
MADGLVAETTAGPVLGHAVTGGVEERRVLHFGGVPYASAPRFGLPQPPERWREPLDATQPGAAPPQRTEGLELVPGMAPARMSEQCLTAEIWTTDTDGAKPVLVWIPGGSYRIGGASLPTYDGRHLAADGDVVVIGLNYRLGLLGFLDVPGVPSNLGLRDLLAALDWIQLNAARFGGAATKVTLMGESAGAGAIYHLLTRSHLAAHGAIIWSGSPTMTLQRATASRVGSHVLDLAHGEAGGAGLGGNDRPAAVGLAALGQLPIEALLDLQSTAVNDLARSVGMMPFHPWVDSDVVPRSPLDAASMGHLAPVRLVVGTTLHEMELFRSVVPSLPAEHAVPMLTGKGRILGITADGAAGGFAACGDDLVTAIADIDLNLPALAMAESHHRRGLPVWRASFAWETKDHRACHAADIPFHFGTLDVAEWRDFEAAHSPDADELSRQMRQAWTSFATGGVPRCDAIGPWPVFDGGESIVELGRERSAPEAISRRSEVSTPSDMPSKTAPPRWEPPSAESAIAAAPPIAALASAVVRVIDDPALQRLRSWR